MKKIVLAACLLTTTTIYAEQNPKQLLDNFLSNIKVKFLDTLQVDEEDTLVLMDGEIIRGVLEQLPPLEFSFGNLMFDPDDIAAIVFEDKDVTDNRVHYITHDGRSYLGKSKRNSFAFVEKLTSDNNTVRNVRRDVQSDNVRMIVRKNQGYHPSTNLRQTYNLTLTNGEQFSVFLPDQAINLSDGSSEWELKPDQIQQIYQDGWLFGEFIDDDGIEADFGYAFACNRNLSVQLAQDNRIIELPWHKVTSLCLNDEKNDSYPYPQQRQKDSTIAERKGSYSVPNHQHYENDTGIVGVYDHERQSSVGYEYILPPENNHFEEQAITVGDKPQRVFADDTDDEIPRNIVVTRFVEEEETYCPTVSLQRESSLFSRYDIAFEEVNDNDALYDYSEAEETLDADDEDDDDEEIIFISKANSTEHNDDIAYAENEFPQEFYDEMWDDLDFDFFVDSTEEYDVDGMFDDFDLGLSDLD